MPVAVYPRVCGGTDPASEEIVVLRGLSPRVRGNRMADSSHPFAIRSIPACAGEPPCRVIVMLLIKVYPRVCGGNPFQRRRWYSTAGLSPRVRGKPLTARTRT